MEEFYTSLFGCNKGTYPFRYLGIPMHHRQLLNSEWKKVEEHFEKKLSCWKAKYLSYGGKLVLLNSVLSSLSMFMMSFFEIPKGVIKTWITTGLGSFGKDPRKSTDIGLPNGTSYVDLKIKVV
jgi:hypothetical protein